MRWLRLWLVWLRTPVRLAQFPGVAVAVVASAVVLAGTGAASRLFLASTGEAAFHRAYDPHREIMAFKGYQPLSDPSNGQSLGSEESDINQLIPSIIHGLAPHRLQVVGVSAVLHGGRRHASPAGGYDVQLGYGTGFTAHIHPVARAPGPAGQGEGQGIWVPDTTARALGLRVGDRIELTSGVSGATTEIAGIYRDMREDVPDPFWAPLGELIYTAQAQGIAEDTKLPPPPLLLANLPLLVHLAVQLQNQGVVARTFFPAAAPLSLDGAETMAGQIAVVQGEMANPDSTLARTFEGSSINPRPPPSVTSPLAGQVAQAEAVRTALSPTATTVARFGQAMALVLLVMAALYGVRRRRGEITALSAMGARNWALGARAAVEAALPLTFGLAGGLAAAVAFARLVDPAPHTNPAALHLAVREAAFAGLAGLALFGVSTWASAAAAVRDRTGAGEWRGAARLGAALSARPTWEMLVLVLAGAAAYETATRRGAIASPGGGPQVDELLILAPLLLIGGLAVLATRLLGWLLARRRPRGFRGSPAVLLASRRLAAAPRLALLLVAASAFAVGTLTYAGMLVASTRTTVRDKAHVLVGSDLNTTVLPAVLDSVHRADLGAAGATPVFRLDSVTLQPGGVSVDVLAIDPATFQGAVWWKPSYARVPLGTLLRRLQDPGAGGTLPAIDVRGDFPAPEVSSISVAGPATQSGVPPTIPLKFMGDARVFPGLQTPRPLVVVSAASFEQWTRHLKSGPLRALSGRFELWAKGDPAAALRRLRAAGVDRLALQKPVTVNGVLGTTSFQSVTWSFGLLEGVGGLAVLVTLVGLLLYLQARQRGRVVAGALARRMGLTSGAQRRSVALELAGMLLVALVLGVVLALLATLLVFARLDPLPASPPGPALRVPLGLLGLLLAGVVVVAAAGAALVQRLADRAPVAEVLRLAA
jgi:putative ABC transport system permease protein